MTTEDDIRKLEAAANDLETAAAELREIIREGIQKARACNDGVRVKQAELREIEVRTADARGKLNAAVAIENARRKAEANAKAQAEAAENQRRENALAIAAKEAAREAKAEA